MGNNFETDVVIIGAGPVGLFSVFENGFLGMKSLLIDALSEPGGQCAALYSEKPIYDIPAYPKISGGELVDKLLEQIRPFSPQYLLGARLEKISKEADYYFVTTDKGDTVKAKVIVFATGGGAFEPNRPDIANIRDYEGKSVFYHVKSRTIFANKKVVISGGGDSAVDWAVDLAEIAAKIYLIHRRDNFRAASATVAKLTTLREKGVVEVVAPFQLQNIIGNNGILHKVIASDFENNIREIEADFLLPFYGLKMNNSVIMRQALHTQDGYIVVDPSTMQTTKAGIYAIGDGAKYPGKLKLILTGFSEAALAAHSAFGHVFPDKHLKFEHSTSKGVGENLPK
jgi:thioredoxin reductase (NADPH)